MMFSKCRIKFTGKDTAKKFLDKIIIAPTKVETRDSHWILEWIAGNMFHDFKPCFYRFKDVVLTELGPPKLSDLPAIRSQIFQSIEYTLSGQWKYLQLRVVLKYTKQPNRIYLIKL